MNLMNNFWSENWQKPAHIFELAASTGDTTAQTVSADFFSFRLDNFAFRLTTRRLIKKQKIEN